MRPILPITAVIAGVVLDASRAASRLDRSSGCILVDYRDSVLYLMAVYCMLRAPNKKANQSAGREPKGRKSNDS